MNLSSLFSIIKDFIILNFFKMKRMMTGIMKVVPNTTPRHTSALKKEILNTPDAMNTNSIHVGNKTGCVIVDIILANLSINHLQFFTESSNRNVELFAVFGYSSSCYVIAFFFQDLSEDIIGKRFRLIFLFDAVHEYFLDLTC